MKVLKFIFWRNFLDFRNYPVDYGVDEDSWPTCGLHWRHDRTDNCSHPVSADHHGGRGHPHSAWDFHSQCLPSNSLGHRPSRLSRLDPGFLYWLYDQFLWRKSPGVAVTAFFGCGLGSNRKIGETVSGEEGSLEHLSFPSYSCFPDLFGFNLCRAAPHSDKALHGLYLFGFDLPLLFLRFFWVVDRGYLRKGSHPYRFGGNDHFHRNVDWDGGGFRIPLPQVSKVEMI